MNACVCRGACLAASVALLAACSRTPPTSPGSPSDGPPSGGPKVSELRIAGLPDALPAGASAQLKAEVVSTAWGPTECAAAWAVDNPIVASISPSGLLTARISGYVNVTASCDGLTARRQTKVEAPNPYRLFVVAHDSVMDTGFGIEATMEFLDGPRAGESMPTEISGGLPDVPWPVNVRITADSYQSNEVVLAESTGRRRDSSSPLFEFRVPMTYAPDALTDVHERRMSRTEMEIAHPFTMRVPGLVQIRTWWAVDYNDRLTIELWCGGRVLRNTTQQAYSAGRGFTHDVPAPGTCEVRLRQLKSDASTHYRLAIRYPR